MLHTPIKLLHILKNYQKIVILHFPDLLYHRCAMIRCKLQNSLSYNQDSYRVISININQVIKKNQH